MLDKIFSYPNLVYIYQNLMKKTPETLITAFFVEKIIILQLQQSFHDYSFNFLSDACV